MPRASAHVARPSSVSLRAASAHRVWALALVLFSFPCAVWAQASTQSVLLTPLRASMPLDIGSTQGVTTRVLSADECGTLGYSCSAFANRVQARLTHTKQGNTQLSFSSSAPVRDPDLQFVAELSGPNGVMRIPVSLLLPSPPSAQDQTLNGALNAQLQAAATASDQRAGEAPPAPPSNAPFSWTAAASPERQTPMLGVVAPTMPTSTVTGPSSGAPTTMAGSAAAGLAGGLAGGLAQNSVSSVSPIGAANAPRALDAMGNASSHSPLGTPPLGIMSSVSDEARTLPGSAAVVGSTPTPRQPNSALPLTPPVGSNVAEAHPMVPLATEPQALRVLGMSPLQLGLIVIFFGLVIIFALRERWANAWDRLRGSRDDQDYRALLGAQAPLVDSKAVAATLSGAGLPPAPAPALPTAIEPLSELVIEPAVGTAQPATRLTELAEASSGVLSAAAAFVATEAIVHEAGQRPSSATAQAPIVHPDATQRLSRSMPETDSEATRAASTHDVSRETVGTSAASKVENQALDNRVGGQLTALDEESTLAPASESHSMAGETPVEAPHSRAIQADLFALDEMDAPESSPVSMEQKEPLLADPQPSSSKPLFELEEPTAPLSRAIGELAPASASGRFEPILPLELGARRTATPEEKGQEARSDRSVDEASSSAPPVKDWASEDSSRPASGAQPSQPFSPAVGRPWPRKVPASPDDDGVSVLDAEEQLALGSTDLDFDSLPSLSADEEVPDDGTATFVLSAAPAPLTEELERDLDLADEPFLSTASNPTSVGTLPPAAPLAAPARMTPLEEESDPSAPLAANIDWGALEGSVPIIKREAPDFQTPKPPKPAEDTPQT